MDVLLFFLIPHDDGDTILPAAIPHSLASGSPLVEGFWYKQVDTVPYETEVTTHGHMLDASVFPAAMTFIDSCLLYQLANAEQPLFLLYSSDDMRNFFSEIKLYQTQGREISWLLNRLIELSDQRIWLIDMKPAANGEIKTGAEMVAGELNAVWNASLTSETVQQSLIEKGLPAV